MRSFTSPAVDPSGPYSVNQPRAARPTWSWSSPTLDCPSVAEGEAWSRSVSTIGRFAPRREKRSEGGGGSPGARGGSTNAAPPLLPRVALKNGDCSVVPPQLTSRNGCRHATPRNSSTAMAASSRSSPPAPPSAPSATAPLLAASAALLDFRPPTSFTSLPTARSPESGLPRVAMLPRATEVHARPSLTSCRPAF
jgi:hypothetical protein